MHPSYKLMKQIKRVAGGRVSTAGLERSVELLEASNPIGALLSTVSSTDFRETLFDVAQGRPQPEMLAWMTLAAAGPDRVRQILADRAAEIVAPHILVEVILAGKHREACQVHAEGAATEEEWGAWLLLSQMGTGGLRAVAERRPALRRRLQDARRESKRRINPDLHAQLRRLELV